MSGQALSEFSNFMAATGTAILTPASDILNEAAKRSYALRTLLSPKFTENIQGGTDIRDIIMFDEASTAQMVKPGATVQYQMPQVAKTINRPWRFLLDHKSWTAQEIELSVGSHMTGTGRKLQYKNLKKIVDQRCSTSTVNKMENLLWADPNSQAAEMEDASGTNPISIPAFINEYSAHKPTGWTTIEGQNPTTEAKWRCNKRTYNYDDPLDTNGSLDGLFHALDNMFLDCKWIPPNIGHGTNDAFEPDNTGGSKQVYFCSRAGLNLYKNCLRESNQDLVKKTDAAYMQTTYADIPFVAIETLDTAALYDNSGSFVSESAATKDGPRFYCVNGEYLKIIVREGWVMKTGDVMELQNQPGVYAQNVWCWYNLFARSLQRHGIISPVA